MNTLGLIIGFGLGFRGSSLKYTSALEYYRSLLVLEGLVLNILGLVIRVSQGSGRSDID